MLLSLGALPSQNVQNVYMKTDIIPADRELKKWPLLTHLSGLTS